MRRKRHQLEEECSVLRESGMTNKEIAAELKVCPGTVARVFYRLAKQGAAPAALPRGGRPKKHPAMALPVRAAVRVVSDGRLGRVAANLTTKGLVCVQFGPCGPFRYIPFGDLQVLTEKEVKGTRLEGTT